MSDIGPVSHRFISQRLSLHYVDWGNADAPPVLLVHGGRDHARSWDKVAHALRTDRHVICPDLRGHGDSAWSPDAHYAMLAYVADLAQLVGTLGAETVTLVGHSLGAAICLRYAGLYPQRVNKLVAIEGVGVPSLEQEPASLPDRWREWIEGRREMSARTARRYGSLDELFTRMCDAHPNLPAHDARHLTLHGARRNEDGTHSWRYDNYVRSPRPLGTTGAELCDLYRQIECPTWLVHGADSWADHPVERGHIDHFNNATASSYQNAGHWVHFDRADSFITDLTAFL